MAAKGSGIYGEKKNGKENKNGSMAMDSMPTSALYNVLMNKMGGVIDKMASKPADKDHPYGHGRIEYLCGLLIAFFILFWIYRDIIMRLRDMKKKLRTIRNGVL